jgi:type I restriction enzyme S subunit
MEAVVTKANFAKYPAYRDSGAPWIGEIPTHWETEKGKWLFIKNDRPVRSSDEIVTCFRDGEVTLRSNRRSEGFTNALKEHGYQGIRKGDLVIHAMDAFAGAIGVSDSDGKSTPVYSACTERFKNTVNQYYYAYFLRSLALNGVIQSLAKGIRERSTDFRFDDFGELILTFPPKEEQTAIANFLDEKTAKIDRAIAQKVRMIELLKEHKQIIIQNAVTKGLDPNVKLKVSGVEWIGEIPEHWEVKKLKFLLKIKNGQEYKQVVSEEGFPVIGSGGAFAYANDYLYDGEALLLGRKGTIDKPLYVNEKFWTVDTMFYAIVNNSYSTRFLYFLALTIPFKFYSTSTALPSMTQDDLNNHKVAVPDLKEQIAILNFLDIELGKFDRSISLHQTQIEKLKEYKASLIDSTVTGKIKVSGV